MRFQNKGAKVAYIILCVVLSLALIVGIFWVVKFGKSSNGGRNINSSVSKYSDPEINSDTETDSGITWDEKSSEPTERISDGDMTKEILSTKKTSFEIDIPYGNIKILPSDDNEPYVEYYTDMDISINVRDDEGTSEITVHMPDRISDLWNNPDFWSKKDADKLLIYFYLPSELAELSVNTSAAQVTVNDMKINDFDIDVKAGNVIIKDCVIYKTEADMATGNMQYHADTSAREIDIDVKTGNVGLFLTKDIEGFEMNYDVKIGNFSNKTSFDAYTSDTKFISQKGIIKYENSKCRIDLNVAVGNATLNEY